MQKRYKEEKEERNRNNKIAEEQRIAENRLQERRFNQEQARIREQISDDNFMRNKEVEETKARTEQKDQEA